jgi:glutamine amidotransferase
VTEPEIGILNLDLGNLRSVSNAIYSLGYDPRLVETPQELDGLSHLVIPGVGAFHTAMQHFESSGLLEPVRAFQRSGRPVLGLCLGMQMLAAVGEEGEETEGLGFIPGRVTRLDETLAPSVPHVGWNSVEWRRPHPVTEGVRSGVDFYFVHSYQVRLDTEADLLGATEFGMPIASVVARRNVIGFQFHPEKSQASGLRLIENFCGWDGRE